ncbi:Thioesterase/thiol ester dehydrase-isomerase [Trametes versicolor FP-101664 SS1]|uniref:Thioesterase/thiol ester dehydrase-isomerase n=1 Tax=Trametes versicolor (strain FP-101664) TaxID=717944 RepID=UPI00046214D4|nr:Thioesterase/thiol ester dehydrase-isomerase [Trametes versicolor FP-101664 SS1]EIW59770.1 Thioesterase/thiol ester dehydrase-isomerase [Trametes versicolor FP-101664 SS1]
MFRTSLSSLRAVPVRAPRLVRHSSIRALMDRFKDPTSPFHLPPGTQGPDSPDPLPEEVSPADEGRATLAALGYDPDSFWEQPVVWGDHDSFQHVNNVRYLRFFESGRIHWMRALGAELGGPARADAMIKGKGVSLILKSVSLEYRRPVVFPDTLLVAHKPHPGPLYTSSKVDSPEVRTRRQAKTHFHVMGAIWSYAQRKIVTESDSVLVWYDYDKLAKCDPGEEARAVIQRRMNLAKAQDSS